MITKTIERNTFVKPKSVLAALVGALASLGGTAKDNPKARNMRYPQDTSLRT